MGKLPVGANLLSETQIYGSWVEEESLWIRSTIYFVFFATFTYALAEFFGNPNLNIMTALAVLFFISRTSKKLKESREILEVIAVSSGHPWHESVNTDDTTVFVRSDGSWVALNSDVRLFATEDPLLNRSLLRDGDADGEVLIRWVGQIEPRVLALINMDQALAAAQNRDEDADDEFEEARGRENTAEGVLDREWLDTDEGALEYEPGALLRTFKKSKSGD